MILSYDEQKKRTLLVLYRLTKGMPRVQVERQKLLDEINRLGVMEMTQAEFDRFHLKSIHEFKKTYNN